MIQPAPDPAEVLDLRELVSVGPPGDRPAPGSAGDHDRTDGNSPAGSHDGAGADAVSDDDADSAVVLPDPVRRHLIALAAQALGSLKRDQIPAPLRRVAAFAPPKRVRAGGSEIAATLAIDPDFREAVALHLQKDSAGLVEAVAAGRSVPTADPVEVAALAYLCRGPGWRAMIADAARTQPAPPAADPRVVELQRRLDESQARARAEGERLRADLGRLRAERDEAQREAQDLKSQVRRLAAEQRRSGDEANRRVEDAEARVKEAEREARRQRGVAEEAKAEADRARSAVRGNRELDDVRLRLLLDALTGAATGLVRELALPPLHEQERPADLVAGAAAAVGGPAVRGTAPEDPAWIERLLHIPQVHLVVDGYNVTKTAYPGRTLQEQREWLVRALAALRARTGAEVTCVFDGAALDGPVPGVYAKGVRTIFSPAGITADVVVRQIVRGEPAGRPVVVVSTDREVADGVRAAGAYAVPSIALARLLERV